jgi:hypothetical protein
MAKAAVLSQRHGPEQQEEQLTLQREDLRTKKEMVDPHITGRNINQDNNIRQKDFSKWPYLKIMSIAV